MLLVITYLDRVCISVAGPRMQEALHLGPVAWGWVTGIFTISYAAFEIPSGALGDRIGPRRVLTRIVLWWSAFTSLTGMVTGYYPLLLTRFLFGAGEAGAFPNASVAVARWFPFRERGRALGIWLMASQMGGAIAPLLVVPIQEHYGWRASFYVFGILGVAWSVIWYGWFRDSPAEKPGVSQTELEETRNHLGRAAVAKPHHALPWKTGLLSGNLWAVMGAAFCYVYTYNFFQSWFHTYLVKARGYSENDLLLSSLPFLVGAGANCSGGFASHALVTRLGLKWGRCSIGAASLAIAAACAVGGDVHAATGRRADLAVARLRRNLFSANDNVCGMPGYRRRVCGCGGWSDEHRFANWFFRVVAGVRVSCGSLRQLQPTLDSHGSIAPDRRVALA
ncbi:MAG: MFS transporter [Bryobacteraceae bacterium]